MCSTTFVDFAPDHNLQNLSPVLLLFFLLSLVTVRLALCASSSALAYLPCPKFEKSHAPRFPLLLNRQIRKKALSVFFLPEVREVRASIVQL